jgi:hypothetical protein
MAAGEAALQPQLAAGELVLGSVRAAVVPLLLLLLLLADAELLAAPATALYAAQGTPRWGCHLPSCYPAAATGVQLPPASSGCLLRPMCSLLVCSGIWVVTFLAMLLLLLLLLLLFSRPQHAACAAQLQHASNMLPSSQQYTPI